MGALAILVERNPLFDVAGVVGIFGRIESMTLEALDVGSEEIRGPLMQLTQRDVECIVAAAAVTNAMAPKRRHGQTRSERFDLVRSMLSNVIRQPRGGRGPTNMTLRVVVQRELAAYRQRMQCDTSSEYTDHDRRLETIVRQVEEHEAEVRDQAMRADHDRHMRRQLQAAAHQQAIWQLRQPDVSMFFADSGYGPCVLDVEPLMDDLENPEDVD